MNVIHFNTSYSEGGGGLLIGCIFCLQVNGPITRAYN